MCLGIPMKILKIENDRAIVTAGQIRRSIAINMLDRVNLGDYVIVHAGFAIEKIDPQKAEETLRMLEEIQ
ncbi:MAG: HypC/HybG/HupF family hydrogenase formation chaperone [Candidatus Omnitrophica bacterium]|nr:HypC/HybG/HupF family hydrogenase formation chaperone [Candidatus Omnitrophota bacterium]